MGRIYYDLNKTGTRHEIGKCFISPHRLNQVKKGTMVENYVD